MVSKCNDKKSRGTVLLATLIINSVIALLVLSNIKSQLLVTKAFQSHKKKQDEYYRLKVSYQKSIDKTWLTNDHCLYQTTPQYRFPASSSELPWCIDGKNIQYQIWDGGLNCCLKTSDLKYAHIYYVELRPQRNQVQSRVIATMVSAEVSTKCHCLTTSGITEGIVSIITL